MLHIFNYVSSVFNSLNTVVIALIDNDHYYLKA